MLKKVTEGQIQAALAVFEGTVTRLPPEITPRLNWSRPKGTILVLSSPLYEELTSTEWSPSSEAP